MGFLTLSSRRGKQPVGIKALSYVLYLLAQVGRTERMSKKTGRLSDILRARASITEIGGSEGHGGSEVTSAGKGPREMGYVSNVCVC